MLGNGTESLEIFERTSAVAVTVWPSRSRPDVGAGLMEELILELPESDNNSEVGKAVGEWL